MAGSPARLASLKRASSSTAEQRTLNPQVLGSNPRGRTYSELGRWFGFTLVGPCLSNAASNEAGTVGRTAADSADCSSRWPCSNGQSAPRGRTSTEKLSAGASRSARGGRPRHCARPEPEPAQGEYSGASPRSMVWAWRGRLRRGPFRTGMPCGMEGRFVIGARRWLPILLMRSAPWRSGCSARSLVAKMAPVAIWTSWWCSTPTTRPRVSSSSGGRSGLRLCLHRSMSASRMWPGWRLAGTSPAHLSALSSSRVSCCTGVPDLGGARPSPAEAARWLVKAEEDLAVAQLLARTESPVRWAACFHSQQAAEKAIKSLLVLAGVDFSSQPRPWATRRPPSRGRAMSL